MTCWKFAVSIFLAAVSCAACGSLQDSLYLPPPDLMDRISNADLSAPAPIATGAIGPATAKSNAQSEKYYGQEERVNPGPSAAGLTKGDKGFDLNFSEAELQELTKVILGDTLQVPYVYDPRVQGRVTVSTGGPVSKQQLLKILEGVLNVNQGALIAEGERYRIVPKSEAAQEAFLSFDYARERRDIGAGYGVSAFPLRYASSETMMRMLNSVGAQAEDVPATVHKDLLIVRGTGQQRQALLDIARSFDVDWMKGQSGGVFPLRNASAEEVIKELQGVFQAEGLGKGLVRFEPIKRLNAVLILTQKANVLDKVETWIERLDRVGGEGDNYYVYRVENGRATDLAEVLKATFGAGGGVVKSSDKKPDDVSPNSTSSTSDSFGVSSGSSNPLTDGANSPFSTGPRSSGVDTSAPEQGVGSAATDGSKDGPAGLATASLPEDSSSQSSIRIVADERNNKLLIKASARDYRQILSLLKKIDQPPLQVLINATLAEVTLNDRLEYGVQFFLQKKSGSQGLLGFTNGTSVNITPAVPGLNFVVGSIANDPKVIIDALANETAVRVVSSPSVVVLHNQSATLQVGDEVPISTRQAQSVVNPDAPLVNEITFKNTGVILKVTPRINSNGLVSMEIVQEISAVASQTGEGGTLTPTISQRRISSTIAVQSGQMVVLGGLMSERMSQEKSGIPLINKIPYIGDVLGNNTNKSKTKTELVVFLRPVVIRDPEDASRMAESVRAVMESMAPRPSASDEAYAARHNGSFSTETKSFK